MCRLIICILIIIVSASLALAAEALSDFEDGTLATSTGGEFRKYEGVPGDSDTRVQTIEVTTGIGAAGSSHSMHLNITEGNSCVYYYSIPGQKLLIPQADGANRLSFYMRLPEGYPRGGDNNFHVGTYTRDPESTDLSYNGDHFYHYFSLPGTSHWTRIVCNTHPNHKNVAPEDPENNPVAWGYFDGFTRFYLAALRDHTTYPWDVYYDDVKFYVASEAENDDNINSIACTYMGEGRFIVGWRGNSQYVHNGDTYDLYWSTSPITNANYTSATKAAEAVALKVGTYNWMEADITIPATSGTVYFAIKDLDDDSTVVSKIDYAIDEESDTTPPTVTTIINSGIRGGGGVR